MRCEMISHIRYLLFAYFLPKSAYFSWVRSMKNRILGAVAGLLAAALLMPVPVSAVSAQKALVLDGQTCRVLYEKDAHSRSLIASTTKIMTALVVCQQCNVLDRVRIPKEAVGIEGSSMYLREGEVLTVQELLYGLMLSSGNDAAVALAIYCAGTVEGFVELMNDKAHLLDLTDTHFVNPHGLDAPEHYSTAADLARLAAYAMEDPIFRQTVSTKTVSAGNRQLRNHNKLLWMLDGANGVKTGYTKAAGRILVSGAVRQGRQLIAVTIDAPDDWKDHQLLLEEGFSRFAVKQLLQEGQCVGMRPVEGGQSGYVQLLAGEDFSYAIAPDELMQLALPAPGFVYAPIAQGQNAGFAHVLLDGQPVGKVALIYGETVERRPDEKKNLWQRLFGK